MMGGIHACLFLKREIFQDCKQTFSCSKGDSIGVFQGCSQYNQLKKDNPEQRQLVEQKHGELSPERVYQIYKIIPSCTRYKNE